MKDGYVQQIGTPKEVYFHPANMFVAGFIGEPPMNFIAKTLLGGCIEMNGAKLDLTEKLGADAGRYEGREIVFGFRPEAVSLQEGDYAVKGTVELTEMLGDSVNVYMDIAGEKAVLKVMPHEKPALDSELTFFVPQESVYLFDAQTEQIIGR